MPVDRRLTVRNLRLSQRAPHDLVLKGLDAQGRNVCMVWSATTGQLYTCAVGDHDEQRVLDVYGRVDTLDEARDAVSRCPRDSEGVTLLEAVQRAFE